MPPLLEVRNLSAGFRLGVEDVRVVDQVDLRLDRGEVLGLIGESGSGKTVSCMSLLRLLPSNAWSRADHIALDGQVVSDLSDKAFRALRGRRMAMIFQDPVGSFNPVKTIDWHFRHVSRRVADLRPEFGETAKAWREEAATVLRRVGIPHADQVMRSYPHQLSGGMLQRCLIGLILQMRPSLIVADEPTTNLDNIVERQIVDLFKLLKAEIDASFIFITHDMSIAAQICDRLAVMYAGQIVETAQTEELLGDPKHPYSQGLVRTATELKGQGDRLKEIPGELPNWRTLPSGCRFAPRCPHESPPCEEPPELAERGPRRMVRCVLSADGDRRQ